MHYIINRSPIPNRILKRQQHETHTHIVKGAHLEEPYEPAHVILLFRWRALVESGNKKIFGHKAQGNSHEAEVVTQMNAVPVGAYKHGDGYPKNGKSNFVLLHAFDG